MPPSTFERKAREMGRRPLTLNDLPLYASDEEIGEAVLGYERKQEFSAFAALCERDGMPKINPFWGGRYVPSVKAYLDFENGLLTSAPAASNGVEGPWLNKPSARKLRA